MERSPSNRQRRFACSAECLRRSGKVRSIPLAPRLPGVYNTPTGQSAGSCERHQSGRTTVVVTNKHRLLVQADIAVMMCASWWHCQTHHGGTTARLPGLPRGISTQLWLAFFRRWLQPSAILAIADVHGVLGSSRPFTVITNYAFSGSQLRLPLQEPFVRAASQLHHWLLRLPEARYRFLALPN